MHTFIFIIPSENIISLINYKMLLFQLKLQWIGEVKKKRLSEMMNEFRGDKAVKRLAFCERFL